MNSSDSSRINEVINLLIDIKNTYRQTTPNFALDERNFHKIKQSLIKLNGIIAKLNENFGIKPQSERNIPFDFKKDLVNTLVILNSPKNRKKLADLGINADQIVVTGGPVFENDIKIINPTIPETAFKTIQVKIQKFWKTLQTKIQAGTFNKVILFLEDNNIADKILLDKKGEFQSRLSIPVHHITVSSFDQIDDSIFASLNED
jgi:hypothetical protein